jgi:putative hydrolase of the HAD superfamily
MSRIAFFDLDDTLCDRGAAFRRWALAFCELHDLDADTVLPEIDRFDQRGLRPRPVFFGLVRDRFDLAASVEELVVAYAPAYTPQYRLEPAVRDGVLGLRSAGWKVGIVTNGMQWQLDKITGTGLDTVVDGWAISEVEGFTKPDPEVFRRAATACGGSLDDAVWMVGDNPVADIGGAVLSGLRSIWIDLGREWAQTTFKPELTVDGPLAAIEAIAAS